MVLAIAGNPPPYAWLGPFKIQVYVRQALLKTKITDIILYLYFPSEGVQYVQFGNASSISTGCITKAYVCFKVFVLTVCLRIRHVYFVSMPQYNSHGQTTRNMCVQLTS
jgi:hypothetical protein